MEGQLEWLEKEVIAPAAISKDVEGGARIVASSWWKGNIGTTSEGQTCAREHANAGSGLVQPAVHI